ncbi:MAG TPA: hypothetical protein VK779_03625 [Rhizomicrobium sp.]|jgi:hypothetical protein|nr:hypothetical protein [Rhizomicrobium sp.]
MKILIDIPETQFRELKRIANARKLSHASIVREAIAAYIFVRSQKSSAFGSWDNRKIDGLEYQQKLRSEW